MEGISFKEGNLVFWSCPLFDVEFNIPSDPPIEIWPEQACTKLQFHNRNEFYKFIDEMSPEARVHLADVGHSDLILVFDGIFDGLQNLP